MVFHAFCFCAVSQHKTEGRAKTRDAAASLEFCSVFCDALAGGGGSLVSVLQGSRTREPGPGAVASDERVHRAMSVRQPSVRRRVPVAGALLQVLGPRPRVQARREEEKIISGG